MSENALEPKNVCETALVPKMSLKPQTAVKIWLLTHTAVYGETASTPKKLDKIAHPRKNGS
jgi:hypothetical protein